MGDPAAPNILDVGDDPEQADCDDWDLVLWGKSVCMLGPQSCLRRKLVYIVHHPLFQKAVFVLIGIGERRASR